ncbi:MAG: hypothetical protein IPH44_41645 [Myxococcales bacterium]|nr:hypothetical protein [Myxococcales bacterium]
MRLITAPTSSGIASAPAAIPTGKLTRPQPPSSPSTIAPHSTGWSATIDTTLSATPLPPTTAV